MVSTGPCTRLSTTGACLIAAVVVTFDFYKWQLMLPSQVPPVLPRWPGDHVNHPRGPTGCCSPPALHEYQVQRISELEWKINFSFVWWSQRGRYVHNAFDETLTTRRKMQKKRRKKGSAACLATPIGRDNTLRYWCSGPWLHVVSVKRFFLERSNCDSFLFPQIWVRYVRTLSPVAGDRRWNQSLCCRRQEKRWGKNQCWACMNYWDWWSSFR